MKPEIYFSTDVETDGPIPGSNSMLSIGCAAFDDDGQMISTFSRNLMEIYGAHPNPDTMAWWRQNPEAWAECRKDPRPAVNTMKDFNSWVRSRLPVKFNPVFVGYPAGFDFLFVYWYLVQFTGNSPFSFSAIDVKTLAYAAMGCDKYTSAVKRNWPAKWRSTLPHTHVALDDAIAQGHEFFNIRNQLRQCKSK